MTGAGPCAKRNRGPLEQVALHSIGALHTGCVMPLASYWFMDEPGGDGHTGLYYNNNNPLPLIVDAFIRGSLLLYHSLVRLASDTVSIDGPDEFDQSLNILRPASQSSPNRCVLQLTRGYHSRSLKAV